MLLYSTSSAYLATDVTGEFVRQDVVEDEPGVPLTYEVQVLDVNTCEPVEGVMLEMWHSNSTVSQKQ
jgi:protocatechuate 3,4-dioxygenase beta subunit